MVSDRVVKAFFLAGAAGLLFLCPTSAEAGLNRGGRKGVIEGQVQSTTGPKIKAAVQIYKLQDNGQLRRFKTKTTDKNGDFFIRVPAGKYALEARPKPKSGLSPVGVIATQVKAGNTTSVILEVADTTKPTTPGNLRLSAGSNAKTMVTLSFSPSTDNWSDSLAYEARLNSEEGEQIVPLNPIASRGSLTATLENLVPNTKYTVAVRSIDDAGLASDWSRTASITTAVEINFAGVVSDTWSQVGISYATIQFRKRNGNVVDYRADRNGHYTAKGVSRGIYDITVRAIGYQPTTRTLEVDPTKAEALNFTLTPALVGYWRATGSLPVVGTIGALGVDQNRQELLVGLWSNRSGISRYGLSNLELKGTTNTPVAPEALAAGPLPENGYLITGQRMSWWIRGNNTEPLSQTFYALAGDGTAPVAAGLGKTLFLLAGNQVVQHAYPGLPGNIEAIAASTTARYLLIGNQTLYLTVPGLETDISHATVKALPLQPSKLAVDERTGTLFVAEQTGRTIYLLNARTLEYQGSLELPERVLRISGLAMAGKTLFVGTANETGEDRIETFTDERQP